VTIKIADFGIARLLENGATLKHMCGTPSYVAPEVLKGEEYSFPCDMWSCGVIIYILLAGYPPFYHDVNKELFQLIISGTFKFHKKTFGGISDEAKDIITKLLTVSPSERITAEEALRHPWVHDCNYQPF